MRVTLVIKDREDLVSGNAWIDWASLVAQLVKNLPAMREAWVRSLGWEDPLEKEMTIHSRQRSLVGYSPWGRKESDTTERLHFHS